MQIKVLLDEYAKMPTKAHKEDAGFDLYIPTNIEKIAVEPHSSIFINSGVHMIIPEGYVGMIKSKSGLNVMSGINCEGVVDAFFTGSIGIKAYNHSDKTKWFYGGDKLTQIVVMPIPEVELVEINELPTTDRGSNGFGSSGR